MQQQDGVKCRGSRLPAAASLAARDGSDEMARRAYPESPRASETAAARRSTGRILSAPPLRRWPRPPMHATKIGGRRRRKRQGRCLPLM